MLVNPLQPPLPEYDALVARMLRNILWMVHWKRLAVISTRFEGLRFARSLQVNQPALLLIPSFGIHTETVVETVIKQWKTCMIFPIG